MIAKGTSAIEFFERFPDEAACLAHIQKVKFGEHTPCPHCGQHGNWKPIPGTKKYRHGCRVQISPLKGTAFYRSNLSLMAIFYAILHFSNSANGIRSTFLRKQLGIGLRAAHRLANRIPIHMAAYDRPVQLGGHGEVVEVDELYLRHVSVPGSSRFASRIIVGFAWKNKVICAIVQDRKASTLLPAIERMVRPGTTIITDDHKGYARVSTLGFKHISINHSRGHFFDYHGRSTCRIDSYWAVVRRTLRLYHQVADKNLWAFLAEVECRYNLRSHQQSTFDSLLSSWPDLDRIGNEGLMARYDWR